MKQASFRSLIALLVVLCLFIGCGLEEFIYLYPVDQVINAPSALTDLTAQYYEFRTNDEDNTNPVFKGWEIYYRIYNTKSVLTTDIADIGSYNTNYPTIAVNYLLTTKKYQRLNTVNRAGYLPLIDSSISNQDVYIRLFPIDISQPADMILETISQGLPLRTIDGLTDQTRPDDYDFVFDIADISSSDTDITYSTTWEDDANKNWYVQAYVVAYGFDSSYRSIYSELCSLGYVTIPE